MKSTLTQTQKEEIRYSFENKLPLEALIAKLIDQGYDEAEAKSLLAVELQEYKKELFEQKLKNNNQEEAQKVIAVVIVMVAMIGPVFDIRSPIWYMIAFAGSGIAGYFAYKSKPIAGIIGAIIVPVILPFSYNWYFSGRTRYIKIELVVPLLVAIAPAVIIYYIISKTVYATVENN
jgi:hypothetical protein